MIKDHVQKQEGGDSSTNLQGQTIVINQGISYSDAKEIALDVYKSNFLQLSKDAADLALSRAEELTDNFLKKFREQNDSAIGSMNDPGMQASLYEAQKEYAKTGDKDLEGLLIDILVERAGIAERNLHQIVLDESLKVASKLTAEQMDALTINFLIAKTKDLRINNLQTLQNHFEKDIIPFLPTLSKNTSCYEHLEYVGCGSINLVGGLMPIESIYRQQYSGLFCKGFDVDNFTSAVGNPAEYNGLLIPYLHDPQKLQISAIDESVLNQKATELNINEENRVKLANYFKGNLMSDSEVKDFIKSKIPPATKLFDLWGESALSKFNLTTVGIAIAQANFRRRTGIKLELSIWVK